LDMSGERAVGSEEYVENCVVWEACRGATEGVGRFATLAIAELLGSGSIIFMTFRVSDSWYCVHSLLVEISDKLNVVSINIVADVTLLIVQFCGKRKLPLAVRLRYLGGRVESFQYF